MQQILLVTVPFFALVLCGWGVTRARLLPLQAIPGLTASLLCFALPCMLYRFAGTRPSCACSTPRSRRSTCCARC